MKYYLLIFSIIFFIIDLHATSCQGCPNDNGGGGSGQDYDCDTMGTVIYVDISRPNNNGNGKTWATAKKYLQSALAIANNCNQIQSVRVAEGVYKPNISSTNRDLTFFIGNSYSVEGGYPVGGGTVNHVLHPTILDGELADNINSFHIMVIYNQTNVIIKGLRFRNGFADGSGSVEISSGVLMARDDGAAIYMRDNINLKISNCAIYNNVANDDGGAVFSYSSESAFINTIFSDNTAGVNGGGLYMQTNSISYLTNTIFVDNLYFSGGGGAIYNSTGSTVNIYNSILWDNTNSWNGGGIRNVRYSLIQDNNTLNGGINTNNVFEVDPEFENKNDLNGVDNIWFNSDDGLNVCDGSICVNRGLNTALNLPGSDITKEERIFNSQVDLGPYEKQNFPTINILYPYDDSCLVRVYSGKTVLPAFDCDMISIFEPSSNINVQIKAVSKDVIGGVYTYNSVYYAGLIYYFERVPWGNYNGKITLFFKNLDFTAFNLSSYSINDLPTATNPNNKSHLRILKLPEPFTVYQPNLATEQPIIIDPVDNDIVYDSSKDIWSVTFDNTGELGMFLVTTFYEYIFDGVGDFSEETNWLDNNKPNTILPSFNKITIQQGAFCEFDEALILKPYSTLVLD